MHELIKDWFGKDQVPFKNPTQLARAISNCNEAHFRSKKTTDIVAYLHQIFSGKRKCSHELRQSIECAVEGEMKGNDPLVISEVIQTLNNSLDEVPLQPRSSVKKQSDDIVNFLADTRNRGIVQAIGTFGDVDLPLSAVKKLIEFANKSSIPLSTDSCLQIFTDLIEAEL